MHAALVDRADVVGRDVAVAGEQSGRDQEPAEDVGVRIADDLLDPADLVPSASATSSPAR